MMSVPVSLKITGNIKFEDKTQNALNFSNSPKNISMPALWTSQFFINPEIKGRRLFFQKLRAKYQEHRALMVLTPGHSTRFFPKIARVGNDFFTILIFTYVQEDY